jgi:hypothetical protein
MHTRRMATFLLGAWLGGCLLMMVLESANQRFTGSLLSVPSSQAAAFLRKSVAPQDFSLMLNYQTAEQNRRYSDAWEEAQIGLALALGATLFLGTQRRVFPLAVCGFMLLMLLFEHFGVSPELAFRGRETDFVPGGVAAGRVYSLGQVYIWVEVAKLLLGSVLTGYLFIFRARRTRKQINLMDQPQRSQINR